MTEGSKAPARARRYSVEYTSNQYRASISPEGHAPVLHRLDGVVGGAVVTDHLGGRYPSGLDIDIKGSLRKTSLHFQNPKLSIKDGFIILPRSSGV